ncbi:unnamed protein product, partial [Notodromas monacha]
MRLNLEKRPNSLFKKNAKVRGNRPHFAGTGRWRCENMELSGLVLTVRSIGLRSLLFDHGKRKRKVWTVPEFQVLILVIRSRKKEPEGSDSIVKKEADCPDCFCFECCHSGAKLRANSFDGLFLISPNFLWDHDLPVEIGCPLYICELQPGMPKGFMLANGDGTRPDIPGDKNI